MRFSYTLRGIRPNYASKTAPYGRGSVTLKSITDFVAASRTPLPSIFLKAGRFPPALINKPPEPHIVHKPQHHKYRQHIRSAVTHQRQRNTSYRHPSHHHSDVHHQVKQQHTRYSHTDIHTGSIVRPLPTLDNTHEQQEVQS